MSDARATLSKFAKELKAYRSDPVGFCRRVIDLDPHEGQQRWLTSAGKPENALVTGNRWGKSHIAAARIIHRCAYRTGWTPEMRERMNKAHQPYHAINVSLTADQAQLVWHKVRAMLLAPKAQWLVESEVRSPFPRITLVNGAVIEARSTGGDGERLLGNNYDLVNWDEAAYEKKFEYIRDNVLRMRVVDRAGTIDYTSTGNGRNAFGMFFLRGLEGKDENLYSQTGPTFENPNVDHSALLRNMERMSERMRRQTIQGEIVDAGGGFFDIDDLEAALRENWDLRVHKHDDEDQIAHAEVYVDGMPWHNRYPSHRYVHFWDVADKQDWTVGWTLDCSDERLKVVEFERFHRLGWSYNYDRMRERHRRYQVGDVQTGISGKSKTYYDATGVGDTIGETLSDIKAEGLKFTKPVKDEILAGLQSAFSLRQIEWPMIPVAYDEHKFYEREDDGLVQDCVMALAGAVHFGKRKRFTAALAI